MSEPRGVAAAVTSNWHHIPGRSRKEHPSLDDKQTQTTPPVVCEPVGVRRIVEVPPGGTTAGTRGTRLRIDVHVAHQ
jgi:hypothetical protein